MSEFPLKTKRVAQIGIVVADIEKASQAWARAFGLPAPAVVVTDPVEVAGTEYEGEPTTGRAKLAFFHFDNIDVELIEPIGGPSTWRAQLEQQGNSLHHIAFHIEGMQKAKAYLGAEGIPLIQRGEYKGGRYAYFDAVEPLGLILELLEND